MLSAGLLLPLALVGCTAGGSGDPTASPGAERSSNAATPGASQAPSASTVRAASSPSVDDATRSAVSALARSIDRATDLPSGPEDYVDDVVRTFPGGETTIDVPAGWTLSTTDADDGGPFLAVGAPPEFDVAHPNVYLYVNDSSTPAQLLETKRPGYSSVCATVSAARPYDDGRLVGVSRVYSGCVADGSAETGTVADVAVRSKADPTGRAVLLDFTLVSRRDTAALIRAVESLRPGG